MKKTKIDWSTGSQYQLGKCLEREAERNKPSPKITFQAKMEAKEEKTELDNLVEKLTEFTNKDIKLTYKQWLVFAYAVYADVNHRHAINMIQDI